MEFFPVIKNVIGMDKEEIERAIRYYDYDFIKHGVIYRLDVLNQIEENNFIEDQTCLNEFAQNIEDWFNTKYEPKFIAVGYLKDGKNYVPAVKILTMGPDCVLTADSVYGYDSEDDNNVYKENENMDLSIQWLKILKQNYGIGYIQKLLVKKQQKLKATIDEAYKELDDYTQKLAKVNEENYNGELEENDEKNA